CASTYFEDDNGYYYTTPHFDYW
nr:immunoglobulin heavy chain junction region [Macaca mulatta]MOV56878.1 immunoglobulin heavy chain junction region [Macaca mulatta]MOV59910.1 immunoglobulin heavy chain junction region [Macaca mulatta]